MKYLVMECHPGYAVVLDEEGCFFKVANLGYEVGETVDSVIKAYADEDEHIKTRRKRPLAALLASVACFCLVFLGAWQYVFTSFGTVRMQINPDVLISVNRLDYVVGLEGLNEDGEKLVDGLSTFGKKVDTLSDELADRAMAMGYLDETGKITLTVDSANEKWKKATEEKLILELNIYLQEKISVEIKGDSSEGEPSEMMEETGTKTIIIPVTPETNVQKENGVFQNPHVQKDFNEDNAEDPEDDNGVNTGDDPAEDDADDDDDSVDAGEYSEDDNGIDADEYLDDDNDIDADEDLEDDNNGDFDVDFDADDDEE